MIMIKSTISTLGIFISAASVFADGISYTNTSYNEYMNTSNDTFTSASSITFKEGWTSNYDTVNAEGSMYFFATDNYDNTRIYNVSNANISLGERIQTSNKVSAVISNSSLNLSDVYLTDGSNLKIKDSTTTFSCLNDGDIRNGSIFTIEGGSVTAIRNDRETSGFSIYQGSSFTVKNANVDFSGFELRTRTDSSYSDVSASITIDNSTFTTGFVDIYGYAEAGASPKLNIVNNSNVTLSLHTIETNETFDLPSFSFVTKTESFNIRGGIITVSGDSTLNLTGDMVEQGRKDYNLEQPDQSDNPFADLGGGISGDLDLSGANQQDYTTYISIEDGSKIVVNGDTSVTNLKIEGYLKTNTLDTDNLIVSEDATIILTEGETANFENLTLVIENEVNVGDTVDISAVLSDGLSVVLASLEENDIITILSGEESFSAKISQDGYAIVSGVIPEPSCYAFVFSISALIFLCFSRRKL